MLLHWMDRGVDPSQWPILNWVTRDPLMDRAVQNDPADEKGWRACPAPP